MSVYLIDYENVHFGGLEGVESLSSKDTVVIFYGNDASTLPMDLHVRIVESGAALQYMKIEKMAKNYLDFQLSAISGYLVATTKQTDFVVVSNDKGFDSVLDLWNNADFVGRKLTFIRRDQIAVKGKKGKAKTKTKEEKAVPKKKTQTQKKMNAEDSKDQNEGSKKQGNEPKKQSDGVKKQTAVTLSEAQKKRVRGEVKDLNLKPNDYNKIYRAILASKDKHEYNIELIRIFKDQDLGNQVYKATKKEFS